MSMAILHPSLKLFLKQTMKYGVMKKRVSDVSADIKHQEKQTDT
jgi:hypothetical protein